MNSSTQVARAVIDWKLHVWFQLETGEYPPHQYREGSVVSIEETDNNTGMVKVRALQDEGEGIWIPKEYIVVKGYIVHAN